MYKDLIAQSEPDMRAAVERFQGEIAKLRTGRANPQLVEDLSVDAYGTPTPLKQIANISVPEARQLLVQPWDRSMIEAVEVAIQQADLGVTPSNDGIAVRITLPPMTEDNRKELVKVLNQRAEEARVAVRAARENAWKAIQDAEKNKDISEDDKFAGKEDLQKSVDAVIKEIDDIREKKEEDIMTV